MLECGPAGAAAGKGTRLGRHNKSEFTSVLGKKKYIYIKELKIYFKIFEKCIEKCIEKNVLQERPRAAALWAGGARRSRDPATLPHLVPFLFLLLFLIPVPLFLFPGPFPGP